MITQATILGIQSRTTSVANGGPDNSIQATKDGFGSPETSERENCGLQGLMAGWNLARFHDTTRTSDTISSAIQQKYEEEEDCGNAMPSVRLQKSHYCLLWNTGGQIEELKLHFTWPAACYIVEAQARQIPAY